MFCLLATRQPRGLFYFWLEVYTIYASRLLRRSSISLEKDTVSHLFLLRKLLAMTGLALPPLFPCFPLNNHPDAHAEQKENNPVRKPFFDESAVYGAVHHLHGIFDLRIAVARFISRRSRNLRRSNPDKEEQRAEKRGESEFHLWGTLRQEKGRIKGFSWRKRFDFLM